MKSVKGVFEVQKNGKIRLETRKQEINYKKSAADAFTKKSQDLATQKTE